MMQDSNPEKTGIVYCFAHYETHIHITRWKAFSVLHICNQIKPRHSSIWVIKFIPGTTYLTKQEELSKSQLAKNFDRLWWRCRSLLSTWL